MGFLDDMKKQEGPGSQETQKLAEDTKGPELDYEEGLRSLELKYDEAQDQITELTEENNVLRVKVVNLQRQLSLLQQQQTRIGKR